MLATRELQRCTTHLKRNVLKDVRHGDKNEVAEDLKVVFRTGDPHYTVEAAYGQNSRGQEVIPETGAEN